MKKKIYGSMWNPIVGIVMFFLFMTACMFGFYHSGNRSFNGVLIPATMFALYAAIGIIALVIRRPKLIISDYSVMVNTYVPWEVFSKR